MPFFAPQATPLIHTPTTDIRPVKIEPRPKQAEFIYSRQTIVCLQGPMGEGKCASLNYPILMHDGSIKAVQDVAIGDAVMGDDSRPRTVLQLARGRAEMFEVTPTKGDPFTVTGEHILVLKRTKGTAKTTRLDGQIVEITVNDYLRKSTTFRNTRHLFHVPVTFPHRLVGLPPYLVGLWLGDGTATAPEITTPDVEVVDYLEKMAVRLEVRLSKYENPNRPSKAAVYRFAAKEGGFNWLTLGLRDYGLMPEKFIPHAYKCNSREIRLEMLAGLIDSDGWVNHGGYQITQERKALAEDIVFLARSLGFQASIKPSKGRIKERNFEGDYWRVYINGDCSAIPVRIAHKKVLPRQQKKDPLVTSIQSIHSVGVQDYYGFTTDGNHRYLSGDFLVTHNSWAGLMAAIWHAKLQDVPLRGAIIRDTYENIKYSLVPAFNNFFLESGLEPHWHNEYRRLDLDVAKGLHLDLMGIDDLASLTRLQGTEYGLIWLEEPCPYTDANRANAGLSEDVYNAALTRCARQQNVRARLQLTFNPPDEDHWVFRRLLSTADGMVDPRTPLITKQVINIPYGHNTFLKEESRQATIAAYMHDPVAYARFVKGEPATKYPGKPVTGRLFNQAIHVSPMPLEPVPGLMGWLGWDSWGNPAAVVGQQWPDGRLWILDELVDGDDVRDILQNQLNPLMLTPRWKDKCFSWRQIGDVTMRQQDQSNSELCAADVVQEGFDPGIGEQIPFEPGPSTWPNMRLGFTNALQWMVRGQPCILIDPSRCKKLISALRGRWHYQTNKAGAVIQQKAVKDEASHVADAWANAVAILAPWSQQMDRGKQRRYPNQRTRRPSLAASYNTPAPVGAGV